VLITDTLLIGLVAMVSPQLTRASWSAWNGFWDGFIGKTSFERQIGLIVHMTQGWMEFRRRLTPLPVIRGQLLRVQAHRGLALRSRDEQPLAARSGGRRCFATQVDALAQPDRGVIIDESCPDATACAGDERDLACQVAAHSDYIIGEVILATRRITASMYRRSMTASFCTGVFKVSERYPVAQDALSSVPSR
jgi:hypothetical protein